MTRLMLICKECNEVQWVTREGLVMNAVRGSRMWHVCDECEEEGV